MFYHKRPRSFYLTPTRRRIRKPLVRKSRCALARQCLKDPLLRKCITKGVGRSLHSEIANLCSSKVDSILRRKGTQELEVFQWKDIMDEMKTRAPTMLSILETCTETKMVRKNKEAIVGLITAILCKHRRPSASILQRIVSIILYSGHASKRVSFLSNRSSNVHNYIYN